MGRDYHHGPSGRNQHLAMGSQYMDAEEIDGILRIQWKSLHSGSPYAEDYYYLVSLLLWHTFGVAESQFNITVWSTGEFQKAVLRVLWVVGMTNLRQK